MKQGRYGIIAHPGGVAPRAGAWIETPVILTGIPNVVVAPRAGAWIETSTFG